MGADGDFGRTREGETVEVLDPTPDVSKTVAGVERFLGGEMHGWENTILLEDVGILHEEDLVLFHELQQIFGCLGGLDGVLLGGVELGGEVGEQGCGILLLAVVDEQVVGAVADDQDGGHVAGCSKG